MLWEPINKNSLPGEVRSGFLDIIPFGLSRAYPSGLVSLSNVPSLERLFALWPVYNLSRALAIPNSSQELSETPDKLPASLDALRIRQYDSETLGALGDSRRPLELSGSPRDCCISGGLPLESP